MDRQEALRQLNSQDAHERLRAARFLAQYAQEGDEGALRDALLKERVGWIIEALEKARQRLGRHAFAKVAQSELDIDNDDEIARQVRSSAIEETTRRLLHEIEPILGNLRLAGVREIVEYETSRTKALHDHLDHVLEAISTLSRAAAVPRNGEFDIGELVNAAVMDENRDGRVNIQVAGLKPHIVRGDSTLVGLALRNGLKNAIEATLMLREEGRKSIVVTWGETDIDYWLAVVDRASGLPRDARHVWEIGTSSKRGHLGMGLAIARSAVNSIGGKIELLAREDGGTRFELKWPIPTVAAG